MEAPHAGTMSACSECGGMKRAGRWVLMIGLLSAASGAAAQERTEPGRGRFRLALGPTIHGDFLRRSDDGFAQLQAIGLKAPHLFGHVVAELDLRVASSIRIGVAGGVAWRSAGRIEATGGVAPRDIESSWQRGYGEAYAVVGAGRWLGPVWMDLGARASLGGGRTTWRMEEAQHHAPIVRGTLALEAAFLVHGELGVAARLGYALVRSGAMGPAELYFDHSHLFFDLGIARTFG